MEKDLIKDAINIIWNFEYPQSFYTKEDLALAIGSHFDCKVNPEYVKDYVIKYIPEQEDRQLILTNIMM